MQSLLKLDNSSVYISPKGGVTSPLVTLDRIVERGCSLDEIDEWLAGWTSVRENFKDDKELFEFAIKRSRLEIGLMRYVDPRLNAAVVKALNEWKTVAPPAQ